jgi:hypothetical protein
MMRALISRALVELERSYIVLRIVLGYWLR